MKTVKTASGYARIEDDNQQFISAQLQSILQEHRATLIHNLIRGGLHRYIDYKFNRSASPLQLLQIEHKLQQTKHAGINMHRYESILQAVIKYPSVELEHKPFYDELDEVIHKCLLQTELFQLQPIQSAFSK